MNPLARPLPLPCGATLSNRIAKAAMTEGLADPNDCASDRLATLYGRWSDGGAGLLITGNVMVDPRYLERPGNVVVQGNEGFDAFANLLVGRRPEEDVDALSEEHERAHREAGEHPEHGDGNHVVQRCAGQDQGGDMA